MSDNRKASELVAELAQIVRDLPDDEVAAELRALRAAVEKFSEERDYCHGSCHCSGIHVHCSTHCNWGHCNCAIWHFITTTVLQPTWTSISSGTSNIYTVT